MIKCLNCGKDIASDSRFCKHCGAKVKFKGGKRIAREPGTGTVFPVFNVHSIKYIAKAPCQKGQKQIYIGRYSTREAAEQALESYLTDGIVTPSKPPTFALLYQEWSKVHFKSLTKSGIQGYQTGYSHLSSIHNIEITKLKIYHYQQCIDECAKVHTRSVCEKMKQTISQVCKYAMQNDLLNKNYSLFLVLPKREKKAKQIFSDEEILILWQHTDDNRVRFLLFLIYTGFRLNEAFSIRKENVHLEERYIVGGLKTEAGKNRIVPILSDDILSFVKCWMESSKTEYLINDDPSNYRKRRFYPVLSELKIIPEPTINNKGRKVYSHRLTPHCTRHTFASIAVKCGVPPEILKQVMGHSSYQTTVNHYVHTDIKQLMEGMSKFHI